VGQARFRPINGKSLLKEYLGATRVSVPAAETFSWFQGAQSPRPGAILFGRHPPELFGHPPDFHGVEVVVAASQ